MQIDVYSQVGFVMLIGLSAKNAILALVRAWLKRSLGVWFYCICGAQR